MGEPGGVVRVLRRTGAIVVAGATAVCAAGIAAADPGRSDPACPVMTVVGVERAALPVVDWAENVGYDRDGNRWVSRSMRGVVERYDRAGRLTGTVPVVAPGAVRPGPDGAMYVLAGDVPLNLIPGIRNGRVLRIDADRMTTTVHAEGLGMPNGLAFGPDGDAYVADSATGLVRLVPDGAVDHVWTALAPKSFRPDATSDGVQLNGLVAVGDALYATFTASPGGRVIRVPFDDPGGATIVADLTAPFPGFVDDLVELSPGVLAAALTTGLIATVDLASGRVCTTEVGSPLTSLAVVPGAPGRLVAAGETGDLFSLGIG